MADNVSFCNQLLDALPCGIVIIDSDGYIAAANKKYCESHGINIPYLSALNIADVDSSTNLAKMLKSTNETSVVFRENDSIIIQNNYIKDKFTAYAAEMTFKAIEFADFAYPEPNYSHINEDIHKLFQSNWDVIYASDDKGITLEVSSASKKIWGVEAKDLIGKSVYELEKRRIYYPSITRMVLETKRRVQALQTTATGKKLLVFGTPIKDKNGNIVRVINTSRLILDKDDLSTELEETKMLLEGYKRELEHTRIKEQEDSPFIMNSANMAKVLQLALKVSSTDISVIITGESGVGKEVLANYIYSKSNRQSKPYIKINCGAIPPTLLESEMFGYEKGAFTGAEKSGKMGIFELANHGTLFLDEIAEIPKTLQVKFLRVLQENEIMRIGGTKSIPVDVRIIAATNKNLYEEVKKSNFRKDLYYRLSVVPIQIPSLRNRRDDILPLSLYFLDKYNKKYKTSKTLSSAVMDIFMEYRWDGNVRELQNTIERIVVLSPTDIIGTDALPENMTKPVNESNIQIDSIMPLKKALRTVEDQLIDMARSKYHTTTKIAQVLEVDQSTISRKLRLKK